MTVTATAYVEKLEEALALAEGAPYEFDAETKTRQRRIRTAAGARRFGAPIGSIIRADGTIQEPGNIQNRGEGTDARSSGGRRENGKRVRREKPEPRKGPHSTTPGKFNDAPRRGNAASSMKMGRKKVIVDDDGLDWEVYPVRSAEGDDYGITNDGNGWYSYFGDDEQDTDGNYYDSPQEAREALENWHAKKNSSAAKPARKPGTQRAPSKGAKGRKLANGETVFVEPAKNGGFTLRFVGPNGENRGVVHEKTEMGVEQRIRKAVADYEVGQRMERQDRNSLTPKQRAEYDRLRKAGEDHDPAMNKAEKTDAPSKFTYGTTSKKEEDEVTGWDTIVRDWYAEAREAGSTHADAKRIAQRIDRLSDAEFRKYMAFRRKNVKPSDALSLTLNGEDPRKFKKV